MIAPISNPAARAGRRPRPGIATSRIKGLAASDHLNMIRGLAAVVVLFHHARPQFFGAFRDSVRGDPLAMLVFVLTRFGHTSVMIFFVLSGLLVGGGVVEGVASGRWSWKDYLARRLVRLYLVLIPVVVITLALDRIWTSWAMGWPPPAGAALITPRSVTEGSTAAVVAGNLLFLQNVCVRPLGGNVALWSLSNEFWYYAIFPCLWLALLGPGGRGRRAGLALASVAMLAFVGRDMAFYFLIWLVGVAVCIVPSAPWLVGRPRRARVAIAVAAVPLVATIGLIALRKLPEEGYASDMLVGLAFGAFLYFLLQHHVASPGGLYSRFAAWLAGFSYSLYLLHMPVLLLLRACFTYEVVWEPDPAHLLAWLALMLVVMALAYALSLATEARTDDVRRALMKLPRRWSGERGASVPDAAHALASLASLEAAVPARHR